MHFLRNKYKKLLRIGETTVKVHKAILKTSLLIDLLLKKNKIKKKIQKRKKKKNVENFSGKTHPSGH